MEQIITTLIVVFVVATLTMLAFVLWTNSRRDVFSGAELKYIRSQWARIEAAAKQDVRHAIMDADKLLDHVMAKRGFPGHLGEKLKKSGKMFSDLNGVWHAHKVRNKLAHELGYQVSPRLAKTVLAQFKRALKDLGVKF